MTKKITRFRGIKTEKTYDLPVIDTGKSMVEKSGYVDTKTLVQQMVLGGIERAALKSMVYDVSRGKDVSVDSYDPLAMVTRSMDCDYFEADRIRKSVKERINQRIKARVKVKEARIMLEKAEKANAVTTPAI